MAGNAPGADEPLFDADSYTDLLYEREEEIVDTIEESEDVVKQIAHELWRYDDPRNRAPDVLLLAYGNAVQNLQFLNELLRAHQWRITKWAAIRHEWDIPMPADAFVAAVGSALNEAGYTYPSPPEDVTTREEALAILAQEMADYMSMTYIGAIRSVNEDREDAGPPGAKRSRF